MTVPASGERLAARLTLIAVARGKLLASDGSMEIGRVRLREIASDPPCADGYLVDESGGVGDRLFSLTPRDDGHPVPSVTMHRPPAEWWDAVFAELDQWLDEDRRRVWAKARRRRK